MDEVIGEIKQKSQQDIAEIIKEINEEGFNEDNDLCEFIVEDDRFNEKNRTFNTTGKISNFIKVEGEEDQHPSEPDEDDFSQNLERQASDLVHQTTDEEIEEPH
jgi:hypothetical protein